MVAHFPVASPSVYPSSYRGVEMIRQGEEHWSHLPKTELERNDLTEKFQSRESHTDAGTDAETRNNRNQIAVPSKCSHHSLSLRPSTTCIASPHVFAT